MKPITVGTRTAPRTAFFALDKGAVATARVPALDGSVAATVEARRVGTRIAVAVEGACGPWSVLLRGRKDAASVTGGTARRDALGARAGPDAGVQAVVVRLEETQ